MRNTSREADDESTGIMVYHRDKRMNEIQKKMEENRKKMFANRLALKKYAKTNSNPNINEIVKKYDDYYYEFKANIKLQIDALEQIMKHLNHIVEEQEHYKKNNELDLDTDMHVDSRTNSQLKKDKKAIMKEIENLKKLL
jgi:hypothetical protein